MGGIWWLSGEKGDGGEGTRRLVEELASWRWSEVGQVRGTSESCRKRGVLCGGGGSSVG